MGGGTFGGMTGFGGWMTRMVGGGQMGMGGMNGGIDGMNGGMGSMGGGEDLAGFGGGIDDSLSNCSEEERGAITIVDGSHLLYTPARGFSGTDAFMYTVDDGNGGTASELVLIQVNNSNDPPIAVSDLYIVPGDGALHALDVLANDRDIDGDSFRITDVTDSDSGTEISISPDGQHLLYRGPEDFEGYDLFEYRIEDDAGSSASALVRVTVESIAHDPVASNDSFQVEGDEDAVELDVLENDSNAPDDNDQLQITQVSNPSEGGTVSIGEGSDLLLYQPVADFSGQETFTYMIINDHGRQALATVTIDVSQPKIFAGAVDDTYLSIAQDTEDFTSLDVRKNDFHTLDITIQLISVESPEHGTAIIDEMGETILYKPDAGFTGTDSFHYVVRELDGQLHQAEVTVQIQPTEPITKWATFTTYAMDRSTGEVLTEVAVDESFDLVTFVQDVRPFMSADEAGVFAAYLDVLYPADVVQVEHLSEIQFSDAFSNVQTGDVSKLGILDDVGAMQTGFSPLGNQPVELFRVTFTGFLPGTAVFTTDPADNLPQNGTLIFQPPTELDPEKIKLTETIVEIVAPDPLRFLDVNGDDIVTPMDALHVINDLNYHGSRAIGAGTPDGEGEFARGSSLSPENLDVNQDHYITPLDVLEIINYLNENTQQPKPTGTASSHLSEVAALAEGEASEVLARFSFEDLGDLTVSSGEAQEPSGEQTSQVAVGQNDDTRFQASAARQTASRLNDVALADLFAEDDESLESLIRELTATLDG
jgi:hypothetical protein